MSLPSTSKRGDSIEAEEANTVIELKCALLKKHYMAAQQKENLKHLNEKIIGLKEELEKHKKELFDSIASLQEITALNKRYEIEKEIENVLDNNPINTSGSDLNQFFKNLTLAVEQEKNKLSLQKTLLESQDQLRELLCETEMELKAKLMIDNEESDFNAIRKLSTFLPSLEENLEKCNDSNLKCAEIIESLQRLILHQNILQTINSDENGSQVS